MNDGSVIIWNEDTQQMVAASNLSDINYLPMEYESNNGGTINAKTRIVQSNNSFGIYTHKEIYLMPNYYDSSGNTTTSGIGLSSTNLGPNIDDKISLGSSSYRFKNAYFTGTVTATTFSGTATNVELMKYSGNYNFFLFFGNPTNGRLCYTDTSAVNALTFNPATGTVSASIFSGNFSGTATNATSLNNKAESSLNVASAAKSTKIAITGKNQDIYSLGLVNSSTTTTDGQIFASNTNAITYNTGTGELSTAKYNINSKAIMQYNSTDDCIDFIFS